MTLDPHRRAQIFIMLGKIEACLEEIEQIATDGNFQAGLLALAIMRRVVSTSRSMTHAEYDPCETPQLLSSDELEGAGGDVGQLWGVSLEDVANRQGLVRGIFGKGAHVRIPKAPRRFAVGAVSSQALRGAPGLRLDASYHLDSPEARAKARRP